MAAIVRPSDEEMALLAIIMDPSGIDLAEFSMRDARNADGCYRLYDYQWAWFADESMFQIDHSGRNVGKTESIKLRCMAMPFVHEGHSMLITAPELNHLRPLTDEVEKYLLSNWMTLQMMPPGKSNGIARQPHWQVRFTNGTSVVSRLPNIDGRGVKGCVGAGTRVLTDRGHLPVEEIVVGDQVLTHEQRWRPVTQTYKYATNGEALLVKGAGHSGLVVSDGHAFYGRFNAARDGSRKLGPAQWVDAVNPEIEQWYWATPLSVPPLPTSAPRGFEGDFTSLMRFVGHWVADGHIERDKGVGTRVMITDGLETLPDVELAAKGAGYHVGIRKHSQWTETTGHIQVSSRPLAAWLHDEFGELAGGKKLPAWLLGAPEEVRRAFWDGYSAGDGTYDVKKRRWTVSTASRTLASDLRILANGLGYDTGLSWLDPKVTHIRGVALKKAPQRCYRVGASEHKTKALLDDLAWGKIKSVTPTPCDFVYDLSVEEDHSYVAEGVIQHNQHVLQLEIDEAQDFPQAGWREVVETLNAGTPGAQWRVHGVSKGVRDDFYERTQPDSGWTVHRFMGMHRPSWSDKERSEKIDQYGGSRQNIDYRRNVYGDHGDVQNSVFVLARLMNCVDTDEGSSYNTDVYTRIKIDYERFPEGASDGERLALIDSWIQMPGTHKAGYSQRVKNKEIGSPKGYTAYWGGMDVGVTNHPSEILIFGQRAGTDLLELLTRIQLHRVNTDDQKAVIGKVMDFYGPKLQFGIDKTGVGFMLWDELTRYPFGDRIHGFGFGEKRIVGFEDRELTGAETQADLALKRNVVEASTDWLRNDYVDTKQFRLPYDREVLLEFQGQTYMAVKDSGDPYNGTKRVFGGGSLHSLDAAKVAIATRHIPPLEAMLSQPKVQESVLDYFVG